jgi:biopolymer transport protein ExbD
MRMRDASTHEKDPTTGLRHACIRVQRACMRKPRASMHDRSPSAHDRHPSTPAEDASMDRDIGIDASRTLHRRHEPRPVAQPAMPGVAWRRACRPYQEKSMAVSMYSDASQDRAIAQINITPLVDVLLVLLVIFMLAAPLVTAPMAVGLPQGGPSTAEPVRMTLQVSSAGEFVLDGRSLEAKALPAALGAVRQAAPRTVLVIDASADSDYQGFATALAAARSSGLENIALPR